MIAEGTDVEVLVKHPNVGGHRRHPNGFIPRTLSMSSAGDGCLYPYTFNISDYEPITGRVHQPPPAHQAFEGNNFVICNFVPRKVDYHPPVDPGAVLPLERRLGRDHVLLRR